MTFGDILNLKKIKLFLWRKKKNRFSLLRKINLKVCGIQWYVSMPQSGIQLKENDMAGKSQQPYQAVSFEIPEARPALLVSWNAFTQSSCGS